MEMDGRLAAVKYWFDRATEIPQSFIVTWHIEENCYYTVESDDLYADCIIVCHNYYDANNDFKSGYIGSVCPDGYDEWADVAKAIDDLVMAYSNINKAKK